MYFMIQGLLILLLTQSSFVYWEPFEGHLCLIDITHHEGASFLVLSHYLGLQDAPGLPCIFPASVLEPAISSRSPDSFYWKMVSDTKIWVLGVFIAPRVLFLLGSLS